MKAFRVSKLTTHLAALGVLALLCLSSQIGNAQIFNGVSLKTWSELVPVGGVLQVKLFLTEPKPIIKGSNRFLMSDSYIAGIRGAYLSDPTGTTSGVAVLDPSGIRASFTSPQGQLGKGDSDYPLLTLALQLRDDLRIGQQTPLSLDLGSSFFTDPQGHEYPEEFKAGRLTIGGKLSISDVVPGGGLVQAGQKVSIFGTGFDQTAEPQINEVGLKSYKVVDSSRIDVIVKDSAILDSKRVRVKTNTAETTYFTYLRTTRVGQSSRKLLQASEPIFAGKTFRTGSLTVKRNGFQFTGLALQNQSNTAVTVTLKLFSRLNSLIATKQISLPATSKSVADVLEIFSMAQTDNYVRVSASAPMQMLGLLGDDSAGVVAPVPIGLQ
jgi:hypothetical protein